MIKSILLAVDGSIYTEPVLKYGMYLANHFVAHLKVITVIDARFFEWSVAIGTEGFAPVIPTSGFQEKSQNLLEEKADTILKRTQEILGKSNVHFSLEKINGNPVDVICEKSKTSDLMIMGASGEFAKWNKKMLGSTLEATTRLSPKPLFIARQQVNDIKKILVAYDGSDTAAKALSHAGYFSKLLDAELTIVNISPEEEASKQVLNEAVEYLSAYELKKLNTISAKGDVPAELVNLSKSKNSDLIIMGSYGHSRIREAILGSTTVEVMRKAESPILMAR